MQLFQPASSGCAASAWQALQLCMSIFSRTKNFTFVRPQHMHWGSLCLSGVHRGPARASAQVPIPREQIHAIKEGLPVGEAATEYAGQLLRLDASILPRNAQGAAARQGYQLRMGRCAGGACECEAIYLCASVAGRAADLQAQRKHEFIRFCVRRRAAGV